MDTETLTNKAVQDLYPDNFANCYGCGRNNEHGLQLKSYWEGEETVCRHTPAQQYSGGVPGFLYGGMIASLIDCHGAATAAAACARHYNEPLSRFVTAALQVDFLAPTPLGVELEIRGRAVEIKPRKVIAELVLLAGDTRCATGRVVMVKMVQEPGKQNNL